MDCGQDRDRGKAEGDNHHGDPTAGQTTVPEQISSRPTQKPHSPLPEGAAKGRKLESGH